MPLNELRQISPQGRGQLDAIPFATYVDARSLGVGINEDHTIPAGAKYVIFSATGDFYAKIGGTAAVPADVTDGSASELNPLVRHIGDADTTIGLISPAAQVVTMAFYD